MRDAAEWARLYAEEIRNLSADQVEGLFAAIQFDVFGAVFEYLEEVAWRMREDIYDLQRTAGRFMR